MNNRKILEERMKIACYKKKIQKMEKEIDLDAEEQMQGRVKYKAPYTLQYAKEGDIGMDLKVTDEVVVLPKENKLVNTGLFLELPKNYYADVRPKSGLSSEGIQVQLGLIDTGYRGEVKVNVYNATNEEYRFGKWDKIAQIVFHKKETFEMEKVSTINDQTERGDTGFGSSGR